MLLNIFLKIIVIHQSLQSCMVVYMLWFRVVNKLKAESVRFKFTGNTIVTSMTRRILAVHYRHVSSIILSDGSLNFYGKCDFRTSSDQH